MAEIDWMWCVENPKEAAAEITRLRAALQTVQDYIAGEPIANAVVLSKGAVPNGRHPSLIKTIDDALNRR